MATIQIREIPDDTYETIRRRARESGKSIQSYMRDQVVELAARRSKEDAWDAVESALADQESTGPSMEQIIADLADDRR